MSNDEGRTGEGKLRDRLKRRRAQRTSADTVPDDGGSEYDFGYGGWSITLDDVAMPQQATHQPAPERPNESVVDESDALETTAAQDMSGDAPGTARDGEAPAASLSAAPQEDGAQAAQQVTEAPSERRRRAQRRLDPNLLPRRRNRAGVEAGAEPEGTTAQPAPRSRKADSADNRPIIAAPPERRTPSWQNPPAAPESPRARRASSRRERRAAMGEAEDPAVRAKLDEAGARKRRAVRIEGGGTVMIGEDLFPLIDWSTGGIAIASDNQLYRIGDRKKLEIELDLEDYAVNVDIEAEVVNRSSDRTGFEFINPTDRQRQLLRSLTQVSLKGGALAPPANGPSKRRGAFIDGGRKTRTRRSNSATWRRVSPLAAIMSFPFNAAIIALVAGVAILTLRGGAIEEVASVGASSTPTIRAEHAAVAVERLPLDTAQSGVILEWGASPGAEVSEGEALVSLVLNDAEGGRAVIQSPCDCFLARILAEPGRRVAAGETVALLYPRDTEGHVQALFPSGKAPDLGAEVSVDLPYSGESYKGVVERVGRLDDPQDYIGLPSAIVRGDTGAVFARIKTTPAMPAALAGDPAIVTIDPEA